jgi:transaldolase
MRILLTSASAEEVRWASKLGVLDGVLTTPKMLTATSAASERELVVELCHAARAPVYITVHAVDAQAIYRDGKELAKLSDQIVVQVPLVEDAIGAIRRLCSDGVRVAAMLVFNGAQGLIAAKAGAASVITSVDHLDSAGFSGVEVVRELRSVFDAGRTECDVVAVGPSSASQLADCVLAGADGVAVSVETLRSLLVHPLTDRGLDQLLNDLSKQRSSWVSE